MYTRQQTRLRHSVKLRSSMILTKMPLDVRKEASSDFFRGLEINENKMELVMFPRVDIYVTCH